jgi:hypothetical protein
VQVATTMHTPLCRLPQPCTGQGLKAPDQAG